MVTVKQLNYYDSNDFMNENEILYKEDKIEYIKYLYSLEDKRSFRIMYFLFFKISEYEKKFDKNIKNWSYNDFYTYFKSIDDYAKAIKEYEIIKMYFKFMENKKVIYTLGLIDISIIYDDNNGFITHGEYLELKNDIMKQITFQKYYEAAMIILIYHGVELKYLCEYTLDDLHNNKYLFDSLNKEDMEIIEKGENINEYKTHCRTLKLDNNDIGGLIIKATAKHRVSYYRMYNRIIDNFRSANRFDCGHLTISGAMYFFVKECIKLNMSLYDDLLHPRINKEKAKQYIEIAKKYRLDWSMIKNRYVDIALREYEYQKELKQQ